MSLNIKNEQVCALARRAAGLTGKSQTATIAQALERLIAESGDPAADALQERRAHADFFWSKLQISITPEMAAEMRAAESEMYDEWGLPGMIVDSSVLIAVLAQEPDAALYMEALLAGGEVKIPAPTLLETSMVADRAGPRGALFLDEALRVFDISVIPFTEAHAERARTAHRAFGRGSGHPAKLNFGDCISYAVATVEGEPLLFKGDDFTHTDVMPAL